MSANSLTVPAALVSLPYPLMPAITVAARLAALPITSVAHGSAPPRLPDLESASGVVEAATIMLSTDSGVRQPPRRAAPATRRFQAID